MIYFAGDSHSCRASSIIGSSCSFVLHLLGPNGLTPNRLVNVNVSEVKFGRVCCEGNYEAGASTPEGCSKLSIPS
jgi:hypothetical protein